jgi:cell division septal protein FtsQ
MKDKKQRRLSKSAAVYIPICVLLVLFFSIFGISAFLEIMTVEVAGASIYSAAEIVNASGIVRGDNMLLFDVAEAEEKILAAKPYISEVNIVRVLPDSIHIEIRESSPLAVIPFRDNMLIVDSAGRLLERSEDLRRDLIEIRGVAVTDVTVGRPLRAEQGSELQLQYMRDVLVAIEREGLQQDISYLDVSNISLINLGYVERFRVILGGPSNVRHKLSQLPGFVERIDAQHPHGVTGDYNMSDASGEWIFIPD